MNTEKAVKNIGISLITQVLALILQFVNRRIFVIFLDVEYLGYQSLFGNVFTLLSVAELGIGEIISFNLYKEVVNDNKEEIGKLMTLYKWIYRVIAGFVLLAGVLCYFLLPYIVKDAKASRSYLNLVYFLQLASVFVGYFLSYKRTIFVVTQKEYICNRIDLYVSVVIQMIQLVLLGLLKNYIIYLCLQLSVNIAANIIISVKVDKEYPYLKKKYNILREDIEKRNLISDIKNFLIHRIAYVIYGGTDNIVISAFCGVVNVALYGNYVTVKSGVNRIITKIFNPLQAMIGNIMYSDTDRNKLWDQFEALDMVSYVMANYLGMGFYIFFQPFISLWLGSQYLLSDFFVFLYSFTFYLTIVWEIVYRYRAVYGDFHSDRNNMLISAVLNLVLSLLLSVKLGVPGVQIGTIIGYLPIAYGRIRFVIKGIFNKSIKKYIIKHLGLLSVFLLQCFASYYILQNAAVNIVGFIERFFVWLLIPVVFNIIILRKMKSYSMFMKYIKDTAKRIFNNLFGKEKTKQ